MPSGSGEIVEETELKLELPSAQIARFKRHPLIQSLKTGRARTKRLVGTYYDTADLKLKRGQVALRVRDVDKRRIQTLKRIGPAASAIYRREEREQEVNSAAPDTACFSKPERKKLFGSEAGDPGLRPVFSTDIRRTVWLLQDADSEVELALDIGEIRSESGRSEPVCEAELELKKGDPQRLLDIALAMSDRIDFTVSSMSKSDRGYALIDGAAPRPVKARRVKVGKRATVAQSFVAIGQSCIDHLQQNEQPAVLGDDPEGIHQARVAIRRLRAALKTFKAVIDRDRQRYFSHELNWLQKEFGAARDWDVFLTETIDPLMTRFPSHAGLSDLHGRARRAQARAYSRARRAFGSRRYGRLRLQFEQWLMILEKTDGPNLRQPVRKLAAKSNGKLHRKLMESGKDILKRDEATLHEVRLKGKHARYCAEFFGSLYSKKKSRAHEKALAAVQDSLGALNDSVVSRDLIASLENSKGAVDAEAVALVSGWFAARIQAERQGLGAAWLRLSTIPAYWRGT
jgi:inorganic triphosphatase YgiF